jgi:pyrimidine-nucleoside phosphorylase
MRTVDLIQKKRDGASLSREELAFLIEGYTQGRIPDYQVAAWAMAVFFRGMTAQETADLTLVMASSGDQFDLSAIAGIKVDKHSTGGVGDTTTLVLAPLVAAAGVPVAKMSGRGLGHTGGTIDKLESIPGFRVELEKDAFIEQVNRIGVAVIGQSGNLTPADKKLYGLRDVTGTVNSIPLIASSIMSKKIASGADRIVLDVKTGDGAFMKSIDKSIELAQAMVEIGTAVGRDTIAVISSMEEPLGLSVGNALEVRSAIDTLSGHGPADLMELCLELGANMVVLAGKATSIKEAKGYLKQYLVSGSALATFRKFITAQGGNPDVIDNPSLLPTAKLIVPVTSPSTGFITAIQAEQIGIASMRLGAGRATKESIIDLAVGIVLRAKTGNFVKAGDPIAELHVNHEEELEEITRQVQNAYSFASEPPKFAPLIIATVNRYGVIYHE